LKTLNVLRQPDVFKLWLSQLFSSIGDNFYDMAVVWIATREVGAWAGLIVLAGSLPTLIFGIPGGVLVDRWDRRLTMALVDTVRMSILLLLVLLSFVGEVALWHLALVTAINVGLNALFQPALVASVRIVSSTSSDQQAVNALMDVTARLARALSPSLAGILIATVLPRYLFALDALTFGFSALAVYSLNRNLQWKPNLKEQVQLNMRENLLTGWRLIQAHPVMRWAVLMRLVIDWVWGTVFIIGVPLLVDVHFGSDPRIYGYIVAAYGIGSVISNVIIGNLNIQHRAFVMFAAFIVWALGFTIMATAISPIVAIIGSFIASFGGPMDNLMALLYIQDDFEGENMGKVYGLRIVIMELGYSLGVGGAAIYYQFIPVQTGILLAAFISAVCGLVGIWRFGSMVYQHHLRVTTQLE
jgi:MFS transporter, DHA3 family, macrolide efflux protein